MAAKENNVAGKVIVNFIVEADGTPGHFKVLKGIGGGADEEALRVFALSPKWTPGMQNNRPVRVSFTVPVNFTLDKPAPAKQPASKPAAVNLTLSEPPATDTGKTDRINNKPLTSSVAFHQPIYFVNGVKQEDIKGINPKDIKSITVLKDKPAEAYGVKGANGVVLVITKKAGSQAAPAPAIKN